MCIYLFNFQSLEGCAWPTSLHVEVSLARGFAQIVSLLESENFVQKKHAHALRCAQKIAQIQKSSSEFISDLKFLEFVQNPLHGKRWGFRPEESHGIRVGMSIREIPEGFEFFAEIEKEHIPQLGKEDLEIFQADTNILFFYLHFRKINFKHTLN